MDITEKEAPLIEAFLRLVTKVGISGVTLQKIAEEADVSFGKVHYYFGRDPAAVIDKAITYVGKLAQDFIQDYVLKHLEQSNPVQRYIEGTFEWGKKRPTHAAFWAYYYHLCTLKTEYRKNHATFLATGRQRIQSLLMEAVGLGIYQPIKDPKKISLSIHDALVGGVIVALSDSSKDSFTMHKEALFYIIENLVPRT